MNEADGEHAQTRGEMMAVAPLDYRSQPQPGDANPRLSAYYFKLILLLHLIAAVLIVMFIMFAPYTPRSVPVPTQPPTSRTTDRGGTYQADPME